MANEPERPIEKLLRAAAKQRRDECGAPLALHPATRRLLQGEVAREFAKPGGEGRAFAERLVQLWPRFAGGAAIFAVLALAVYVLVPGAGPSGQESLMTRNKAVPRAAETRQLLSPPSAAVAITPAAPPSTGSNSASDCVRGQTATRPRQPRRPIWDRAGSVCQGQPSGAAGARNRRQISLGRRASSGRQERTCRANARSFRQRCGTSPCWSQARQHYPMVRSRDAGSQSESRPGG